MFDKPLLTFSIRPSMFKAFFNADPKFITASIILLMTSFSESNTPLTWIITPSMILNAPLKVFSKPSQSNFHAFFNMVVSPVKSATIAPKTLATTASKVSNNPQIV